MKKRSYVACAIYARTSDEDTNNKEHNSGEQQGYICENLVKGRELIKSIRHQVDFVFIEKDAVSGATTNRKEYQKLIRAVKARKVDAIFAKEISRLHRSLKNYCELIELCKEYNVSIITPTSEFIPNDSTSELIANQLAIFAQFERDNNIVRTKSSIRSRQKNNGIIHGGRLILGFERVKDEVGVWKPIEKEIKVVTHLMNIFLECGNYALTCKKANEYGYKTKTGKEFNKDSLKRILRNEKYIGLNRVSQDKSDDNSEVEYGKLPFGEVVSKDLFEKVQLKMEKIYEIERYSNKKGKARAYPLTGILKHEDGSHFTGELGGKGKIYYYNRKNKMRLDALSLEEAVLNSFQIFEDNKKMASFVRELLKKKNERLELVDDQIIEIQKEIDEKEGEIKACLKNLGKLKVIEGTDRALKLLSDSIVESENVKDDLKVILEGLQEKRDMVMAESLECRPLGEIMKVAFEKLKKSSSEVKKGILKNLCKEIRVLKGNKVEVVWLPEVCGSGGQFPDLRSKWGGQGDLNPRPSESQSDALTN